VLEKLLEIFKNLFVKPKETALRVWKVRILKRDGKGKELDIELETGIDKIIK